MRKMKCIVDEINVTPTGGNTLTIRQGDEVDFETVIGKVTTEGGETNYTLGDAVAGRESCFEVVPTTKKETTVPAPAVAPVTKE